MQRGDSVDASQCKFLSLVGDRTAGGLSMIWAKESIERSPCECDTKIRRARYLSYDNSSRKLSHGANIIL